MFDHSGYTSDGHGIYPVSYTHLKVYPIEYKKGKPKVTGEDRLQITAQALCLEEMFSIPVPEGAIFYGETRRREIIKITEEIRKEVKDMFLEMQQYYNRQYSPKVKYSKACNACSLKAVSYTHLYVYKRQVYRRNGAGFGC